MFKRFLRGLAQPSEKAAPAPPIPGDKKDRSVGDPPLYEYLEPLIPRVSAGSAGRSAHSLFALAHRVPGLPDPSLRDAPGRRRPGIGIQPRAHDAGIVDYIIPPGRCEGLDILPAEIEFAQKNITPRFPHFRFTHADIFNTLYNPQGSLRPETYRLPFADATFDVAYAASLYSHPLPESLSNYLIESRRVLKPGGKCLFSFFLLDFYRGVGTTFSSRRFNGVRFALVTLFYQSVATG